ncbi:hypothetical protein, partial [Acetobacter oeni]|uniref:hypothetical protein n=1 Tax=Acetobacter oeni TaxID=304077 RepID=UPI002232A674
VPGDRYVSRVQGARSFPGAGARFFVLPTHSEASATGGRLRGNPWPRKLIITPFWKSAGRRHPMN